MARPRPAHIGQLLLSQLRRDYTGKPGDAAMSPPEPARALAERVLALLDQRGVPVEPALRRRVLACHDRALLERWLHIVDP